MKQALAEAVGTFGLVLIGTGAIVLNDLWGGALGTVGIAVAFGGIVASMILLLGRHSGAHINPAVSLALVAAGRTPVHTCAAYLVAQLTGGIAASMLLKALAPDHPTLGATSPSGPAWQSLLLEFVLTFVLMLVVLRTSKAPARVAALAIGTTVFLEAWIAGPICGASMNPARSLAPALAIGHLKHVWLYIIAPVAGATAAAVCYKSFPGASGPAPAPQGANDGHAR